MAGPVTLPHHTSAAPTIRPAAVRRRPGRGSPEIRPVRGRREVRQFIDVPWSIYADDPAWVPPLKLDVREFLDPSRHPFYLHGAAAKFLAMRDGRAVGRILVSDDPRFNHRHGTNLGCFGMFESEDDPDTAAGLLDAAAAWLRARGRTEVMGPIDYSMNYPCGLLVDGFDTPPRVMMNHHPAYYAGLLEGWGMRGIKDLLSWWFVDPHDIVARWRGRIDRVARRSGVTVRPFNRKDFDGEVRRCREIYNEVGEGLWGFVGLTDAEFHHMARRLNQMARPDLVLLAEMEGKPVGFCITLPDINEAIRPLNGRLARFGLPIGLVRLLWRLPRVKAARMVVLHVREGYRRRGIAETLILKTLDHGKNTIGYTGAELGWTDEDNEAITRTVQSVGARPYKTYRIYERSIG